MFKVSNKDTRTTLSVNWKTHGQNNKEHFLNSVSYTIQSFDLQWESK